MDGSNIKDKLEIYRRQKRREQMTDSIKKILKAIQSILPWNENKTAEVIPVSSPTTDAEDVQNTEKTCPDESMDQVQNTMLTNLMNLLYFLLWATLYVIAIEYEFGAVYFILSTLIFIWLNTHSRPKKPGELSAYSVFNPNCEAIEGTLDASQFEKEIRYGAVGIH